MKKILSYLFLAFLIASAVHCNAKVIDNIDSYGIENVKVSLDSAIETNEVDLSIEEQLLMLAKRAAFLELREYLNFSVLEIDNDALNNLIVGFSPGQINVDGNIYSTTYTIIFDKLTLQKLKKNTHRQTVDSFILTRFMTHDKLGYWLALRDKLDRLGLVYYIIYVNTEYLELGFFGIEEEDLIETLRKGGIVFIRNNNLNFIRLSLFS